MNRVQSQIAKLRDEFAGGGLRSTASKLWPRVKKATCVLRPRLVRLDRLMRSGEHGMSAAQYSRHVGDPLLPSRSFAESPHVQLLKRFEEIGERVLEPAELERTAYYENAAVCIRSFGNYFHCVDEGQIVELARHFLSRFEGRAVENGKPRLHGETFSSSMTLPIVRPILQSDRYEVVSGNHRLAADYVRGVTKRWVWVQKPGVLTPLQQLALDVGWTRGTRELYQPIETPEFSQSVCVRQCKDRFALIEAFLKREGLLPPKLGTLLEIACSYGWFVKAFRDIGFDSHGVEMDWASREIGRKAYGLEDHRVTRGDGVAFLRQTEGQYDVTSCFSLLHHFVLGRGSVSAEEMLGMIDRATRQVFFFDMGQEHERWFRESLAGWNADRIEKWVRENSSFTRIERLGTDQDDRLPFRGNFGRTLFACTRE